MVIQAGFLVIVFLMIAGFLKLLHQTDVVIPIENKVVKSNCLSCANQTDGNGYCNACGRTMEQKPPTWDYEDGQNWG